MVLYIYSTKHLIQLNIFHHIFYNVVSIEPFLSLHHSEEWSDGFREKLWVILLLHTTSDVRSFACHLHSWTCEHADVKEVLIFSTVQYLYEHLRLLFVILRTQNLKLYNPISHVKDSKFILKTLQIVARTIRIYMNKITN